LGQLVFDGPAASIEQGQLIHLMAGYRGSLASTLEAPTNVG
jgi:hypothetical protein